MCRTLLVQASEKTDLQAAKEMQKSKVELFELFKTNTGANSRPEAPHIKTQNRA